MNRVIRTRRAFSFAMVAVWMLAGLLVTLLAVAFCFWREIREEWYLVQLTLQWGASQGNEAGRRLGELGSARLIPRILDRVLMSVSPPMVKGTRLCGYHRDGHIHHGGFEITGLLLSANATGVKVRGPRGVLEIFFHRLPPGSGDALAGISAGNEVWSQQSVSPHFQALLGILHREGSQARRFLFEWLPSGDTRRR